MLVVCFIYVETTQKAVSHKKMKRTDLYFFTHTALLQWLCEQTTC